MKRKRKKVESSEWKMGWIDKREWWWKVESKRKSVLICINLNTSNTSNQSLKGHQNHFANAIPITNYQLPTNHTSQYCFPHFDSITHHSFFLSSSSSIITSISNGPSSNYNYFICLYIYIFDNAHLTLYFSHA